MGQPRSKRDRRPVEMISDRSVAVLMIMLSFAFVVSILLGAVP
jgi:hypothetical protein